MSVIIAKNQTAGALALTQISVPDNEIPASGQVTLTDFASMVEIQEDAELSAHIAAGDAILNVDGVDLSAADSAAFAAPLTVASVAEVNTGTEGSKAVSPAALAGSALAIAVTANTTKVAAAGSVTTHSDVTDAGSGAIITTVERNAVTANTAKVSADGLVTTHSDVSNAGSGAIITTVERNAVTANTAKVSADGSVTTHSDITDAGSGAIITVVERAAIGGGGVFGQDYQTEVSLARSTTTNSTFQTKLTLTTPSLTGTYRLGWCSIIDQSNTGDSVEARLQNTTDASTVGAIQRIEPKDTDNRVFAGGFGEVVFTGSAKTFQIQWREQDGSTAGIQDARIEIWRVS